MGASFPIVEGKAFIEKEKINGSDRFRWLCLCKSNTASYLQETRKSPWMRNLYSVFEAFRQHWDAVHPEAPAVDWMKANQNTSYLFIEDRGSRILDSFIGTKFTVKIDLPEVEKKGMSRLRDIEDRLRALEAEAARYARFERTDPWPVGAVITYVWSEKFTGPDETSRSYNYAVLKANNGKWYWTGEIVKGRLEGDYDTLVEHLADPGVSNIRIALPEDFTPLFVEDAIGKEAAEKVDAFLADPSTGVQMERPAKKDPGVYVPVVKRTDG